MTEKQQLRSVHVWVIMDGERWEQWFPEAVFATQEEAYEYANEEGGVPEKVDADGLRAFAHEAFVAGFLASREGYNGEHPFYNDADEVREDRIVNQEFGFYWDDD